MRESKNFKDFLGPSFLRQLISFLSHFFDTKRHAQKKRERKREKKEGGGALRVRVGYIYIYHKARFCWERYNRSSIRVVLFREEEEEEEEKTVVKE